jgi:hypothetical protein
MRNSKGPGHPGRIDGKVLPEKAAKRGPTALAWPACMSGRGVKRGGAPGGVTAGRAQRGLPWLRGVA